jgi:hypothetical protein
MSLDESKSSIARIDAPPPRTVKFIFYGLLVAESDATTTV